MLRSCFIYMYSYAICMSVICTCMSSVSHSCVHVCHPYDTRMYSYVIRMSLICTRISSACHSYVVLPWRSSVKHCVSLGINWSYARSSPNNVFFSVFPIRISSPRWFSWNDSGCVYTTSSDFQALNTSPENQNEIKSLSSLVFVAKNYIVTQCMVSDLL